MQSWSVGIICFNELGTIQNVFDNVLKMLSNFGCDFEIILVDDASTDGSKEIIQNIASQFPHKVKSICHESNKGIGASIRDVYFNAEKENLVFVPGDGQFDVTELKPFKEFDAKNYICFYRQENQSYSLFRNILSYFNKIFNKVLLGLELKDVNWVKAYKTSIIQNIDLKIHSSAIESEICAKLNILNLVPIQVKSNYLPRTYGESKGASLTNMIRVGKELLTLFFIVSKFKVKKKRSDKPVFAAK